MTIYPSTTASCLVQLIGFGVLPPGQLLPMKAIAYLPKYICGVLLCNVTNCSKEAVDYPPWVQSIINEILGVLIFFCKGHGVNGYSHQHVCECIPE